MDLKNKGGFMKITLVLVSLLFTSSLVAAEKLVVTGEVFDKEGKEKKFTYEKYDDTQGDKFITRSVYKDLSGEVLVEEKMTKVNGVMSKYEIDQKQLKQKGWIVAEGDKVTFNLKKFRKKNYPQEVSKPKNFLVGLELVSSMVKNWDSIVSGKTYTVKLGVWHRQEAITFDIKKDSSDDKKMVFKMSPTSFLIRAVVDPIYFTFDKGTKELISYKGRTKPKMKQGKNYRDYDGLTIYKVVK